MIDLKTLVRRTIAVLAVLLAFFLLLAVGCRIKAGRCYDVAREADAEGNVDVAVAMYDQTIRNHYPFSSLGRRSRDRLLQIAREHEREGRGREAWETYQTLLSALCAVETGFSTNRPLIAELERKVDDLLPRAHPRAGGNRPNGEYRILTEE